MKSKTVELSECGQLSYSVRYLDYNERVPREYVGLSAQHIEEHYVLSYSIKRLTSGPSGTDYEPSEDDADIFGVSHTAEEADQRLYEKGKEIAESMAKRNEVTTLEDLTRHCQSLPRGGK